MGCEGLLPCSQQPFIGPSREPCPARPLTSISLSYVVRSFHLGLCLQAVASLRYTITCPRRSLHTPSHQLQVVVFTCAFVSLGLNLVYTQTLPPWTVCLSSGKSGWRIHDAWTLCVVVAVCIVYSWDCYRNGPIFSIAICGADSASSHCYKAQTTYIYSNNHVAKRSQVS
jgi:hypothetical protein